MPSYRWPLPHFFDPVNQIVPGLDLRMARVTEALANRDLYENRLDGLFDMQASEINGLEVVGTLKRDILRFGWFSTFTDLLVDGVLSDRPGVIGGVPTLEGWAVVEDALRDLSVTGAACSVRTAEAIWREPSEQVFEWIDPAAVRHRGWVMVRQYYDGPFSEAQESIPNRAQILVVDELAGRSWVQHFGVNQAALGQAIDDPVMVTAPHVVTVWEGASHYDAWKDVGRELMIRFTLQSRTLNRHSSPNMQGPMMRRTPPTSAVPTRQGEFGYRPGGQYYERDADDPEYQYLTWDPAGSLEDAHMERLIQELHVLSRTPPAVFGLSARGGSQSQPASGVAYDRALFPLLARIRRFRRYAQTFLEGLYPGAVVEWPSDPLAVWRERVDAEVALVQAGIGTVEESRAVLGR